MKQTTCSLYVDRAMGLTVSRAPQYIRDPRVLLSASIRADCCTIQSGIFTVQLNKNECHPAIATGDHVPDLGTGLATMSAIDGQGRAWAWITRAASRQAHAQHTQYARCFYNNERHLLRRPGFHCFKTQANPTCRSHTEIRHRDSATNLVGF